MNEAEREVIWWLEGWDIFATTKGWPDFLCYHEKGAFPFCVEVKTAKDTVKPHQVRAHDILRRGGIPVIVIWVDNPGWEKQLKKDIEVAQRKWFNGEEKGVWTRNLQYSSQAFRVPPQSCTKIMPKYRQWGISLKRFWRQVVG